MTNDHVLVFFPSQALGLDGSSVRFPQSVLFSPCCALQQRLWREGWCLVWDVVLLCGDRAGLCLQQLRETNRKQDFPQQASDFSEMNHCNGMYSWANPTIYIEWLHTWQTQQVGPQARFTWAPSCSWIPFSQDLLEIVTILCRVGSGNCQTKKPWPCLFAANIVSVMFSPPSRPQESWCLAPAAASGRCPFRNSALLLKSPSFTESIAAYFKSSFCLEILQTAPYLLLSLSSSPPPFLKLPKQIRIINISVSAVHGHWLHCSTLHQ